MQSDDSLDFNVNLNNFNGSLEILLDLAKSQKVDLEQISITKLACLLYTSPSPRDMWTSRMPSSA